MPGGPFADFAVSKAVLTSKVCRDLRPAFQNPRFFFGF